MWQLVERQLLFGEGQKGRGSSQELQRILSAQECPHVGIMSSRLYQLQRCPLPWRPKSQAAFVANRTTACETGLPECGFWGSGRWSQMQDDNGADTRCRVATP